MLPSGREPDRLDLGALVATPSFHSIPSISKVMNSRPWRAARPPHLSKSAAGMSKVTAVALLVPAYADE